MNSVPTTFWQWLSSLRSDERFAMLVLGSFALVFVIAMIAGVACAMHKNRLSDQLKRELLDRGLSADEIATIVSAKPGKSVVHPSARS